MIFEKIKEILSNQFSVDEETIDTTTKMVEDLGADSLDVVDLLMTIEDEFKVDIPDDDIEGIKTVGDLVEYLQSLTEN